MAATRSALRSLLPVLLVVLWNSALAQDPLERRVTLSKRNTQVAEVLRDIETRAHLSFSYNPALIQDKLLIDASYENKPVRFILDRIFKGYVDYRTKGNYIILQPSRKPPVAKPRFEKIRISGYAIDAGTGTYLHGVSIFDTLAFHSTLSDANGHFEMELGENSSAAVLLVKKQGYVDTSYFIPRETFQSVELKLKPMEVIPAPVISVPVDTVKDTVYTQLPDSLRLDWKKGMQEAREEFTRFGNLISEKLRFNTVNISDTFFRRYQFSVLPGISTNRLLAGNVVNDYSFSLLGGYSKGVNKLEVGLLFNLDEGDVRYTQLGGVFNAVGGKVTGLQAAGVFNVTGNSFKGVQAAGVFNASKGSFKGSQLAGVFNHSKGPFNGFQAASVFNRNSGTVRGVQVAGIWNGADTVYGAQLSCILNSATRVNGVQIGLINIADTMNGVPIGLWSYVRNGYHKWEIGADEVFYTRTAWRTGTNWLHNIIQVGMDPRTTGEPLWFVGYGLGTSLPVRRSYWDIDLTSNWVNKGQPKLYSSSLHQLYTGMDLRVTRKFYVAAGLTLNVYLVDRQHPDFTESLNRLYPGTRSVVNMADGHQLQCWLGGRIALRFF